VERVPPVVTTVRIAGSSTVIATQNGAALVIREM
jgi:hypothetical protein